MDVIAHLVFDENSVLRCELARKNMYVNAKVRAICHSMGPYSMGPYVSAKVCAVVTV